jgi:uncharacterized protein (TIGR02996 family)
MTQEESLLQAIIESPDDDAVRLVYADWLEENGQPERAELIRLEIELSGLPEASPRAEPLEEREEELLEAHALEWVRPLSLKPEEVTFVRGLIEKVETDARCFLDCAEELFRRAPVRALKLMAWEEGVEELAARPELARLRELDLSENGLGDAVAEILGASPYVSGLRRLDLGGNRIEEAGAIALANSPHLANLTELRLDYNTIGVAGGWALARSPYLGNLRLLDLHHNFFVGFGEEGEEEVGRALEERFGDRVRFFPEEDE